MHTLYHGCVECSVSFSLQFTFFFYIRYQDFSIIPECIQGLWLWGEVPTLSIPTKLQGTHTFRVKNSLWEKPTPTYGRTQSGIDLCHCLAQLKQLVKVNFTAKFSGAMNVQNDECLCVCGKSKKKWVVGDRNSSWGLLPQPWCSTSPSHPALLLQRWWHRISIEYQSIHRILILIPVVSRMKNGLSLLNEVANNNNNRKTTLLHLWKLIIIVRFSSLTTISNKNGQLIQQRLPWMMDHINGSRWRAVF